MRQAGRSLPEYRALRERRSFFEVANTPELCAEVTLQPVRRHGVDAAVLFADIVTPVLGMGIDVELVEGVGPVVAEPVTSVADVERLRPARSRGGIRPCARGGADRAARARRRPGARRLLRRALHGRRLPGRGEAESRLRPRQGADVPRARGLACADGSAGRGLRGLRGGAGERPARMRSSCSTPGSAFSPSPTTRSSSRRTRPGSSRPSTVRRSISAPVRRTCSRRWPRPAATRSASTGGSRSTRGGSRSAPTGRCRGTSIPRCCSRPGRRIEAAADDVLARAAGRPGHVFNLGHGVLPDTDPDDLTRLVELVHERTARAVT